MAAKKKAADGSADGSYGADDRIRIEHPETGEAYGVTGKAFDEQYREAGFEAVSFESGRPFELTDAELAAAENVPNEPILSEDPAGAPA